jgi:ketosteroid isomerase-like protein
LSQENVEVVRASLDAALDGEAEVALSHYSPHVIFHPLVAGPYYGREGVAEQMLTWMNEFNDYWFEVERLIDAGGDNVVLLWRQGGEGKASGVRVENEGATIFTVKDGEITVGRIFAERADALQAAGLQE